ncbi:AraC family transcriptional regulator [Sporofaciens sp. SGI.106]|uniref:AraC family transcriptional regulator n=1 Tax=Sporofaciens sp. SGI.106 TaxID=3420568 RepID=UPI002A9AB6AD|nr:AraC family transcriptional regulator [Lachnoclostridium sp.]
MKNVEKLGNMDKTRYDSYYETKKHSDIMYAYTVYPCTIPQDFSFVPLHWQDSFEIIYVKKGTGYIQIDLSTFQAESGDIFVVLPGHLHGLRKFEDSRMEYENIIFDKSFLGNDVVDACSQKYLQPLLEEKLYFPVRIRRGQKMYEKLSGFLDSADVLSDQKPWGYELGVKGYIQLFFSQLFAMSREKKHHGLENKSMEKMKSVISYMEENYDGKITVEDVAAECGYSTSHFMRWFKEMTGTGFGNYLIEFRLGKAAHALRTTEATVLEIAEQSGFGNLSNFNRLFKKKYKMTPGMFRKR